MGAAMRVDIDTELLRAFVAVVEHGGFTRAARRLDRTQSAVSAQIRRLEDAAGSRLFDRGVRGVRLTREGEALLGYARRILDLNDEAMETLARRDVEGTVRLGAMDDYATAVLAPLLGGFALGRPGVDVEVHTGLTVHLLERLGRDLDLVLGMQPAGQGGGEALRRDRAVWAGSPRHDAHARDPIPLALYPPGCLFRRWAMDALDRAGRRWRLAYMSPSLAAVAAAAAAGLAVTVIKAGTCPATLRVLEPADGLPPLPDVDIVLYRAPGRPPRAVARLADHLAAALRQETAVPLPAGGRRR